MHALLCSLGEKPIFDESLFCGFETWTDSLGKASQPARSGAEVKYTYSSTYVPDQSLHASILLRGVRGGFPKLHGTAS